MGGKKKSNPKPRDVINNLPDDLLCHVLSFLSTKEAAKTSILSKRWSNLLQSVPVLDFDDSEILNPKNRYQGVFKYFVNRLLYLRVDTVKRVSLKCHERSVEADRVIRWLVTVLEFGVLDLVIGIDFRIFRLPFNVFASNTLVNLRIGTRIHLVQCQDFVSPTVNSLVLDSVTFGDGVKFGLESILLAFPSLTNLLIHESNQWNYWNGSVSSPKLKCLVYRSEDDSSAPKSSVSFDIPSLVYLDYSDMVADKFQIVKLDSLVEAKLDLRLTANQIMRISDPNNIGFVPGDVTNLFNGIRNVKILCLSPDALEALYYRGETIPMFKNLVSLSLGSDKPHGSPFIFWKLLPSLLLNSLKLETLIIKGLGHYVSEKWEDYSHGSLQFSWNDVNNSLSSSTVKILKITGYRGSSRELNQMMLFLGKLARLEMVRVHYKAENNEEICRLIKDLLHLCKPLSSKCKIQFMRETS